ncbi:MAG: sporulation integral membrane protein YtvI [Thermaerobacter sp.]|nr:sporulation integral membrane protein YtvI [Thermaerobacter sp.]
MPTERSITLTYLKIAWKAFLLITVIYLGYRFLLLSMVILAPFILAVLIALVIDGPVRLLQRQFRLSRNISALLVLTSTCYVAIALSAWVVGRLIAELTYFVSRLPHWQTLLTEQGEAIVALVQSYFAFLPIDLRALLALDFSFANLAERLNAIIPVAVTAIVRFASLVPTAVVFIIVLVVAAFFITVDLDKLKSRVVSLTPPGTARPLLDVLARLIKGTLGWAKTQLIMMFVTSIIVLIGLIILRVRFVMLIAVTVGVVDALPVLGPGAIFVPWIIWSLLADNMYLAGGLAVIYALTLAARYSLSPLILAENIGIEPLPTLIASYVGLVLLGFLGLAMGPMLLVVYKALAEVGLIGKIKEWLLS